MTPITRIALCVFAVFVAVLGIASLIVARLIVDEPPPPPSLVSSNDAHLALLGLSTDERAEVLRNEILVAGFTCDRVQRTFHYQQGSREPALHGDGDIHDRVEAWHAACRDGHAYFIVVWTNGATKVFACGVLKGQIDCSNSRF